MQPYQCLQQLIEYEGLYEKTAGSEALSSSIQGKECLHGTLPYVTDLLQ